MKKTILVIDDDLVLRRLMVDNLKKINYLVEEGGDGLEGWEKIQNNCNPDLIIVDYFMPEMDGLSFINLLQDHHITIPILMISSDSITPPGVMFLQKPFPIKELINKVQKIIPNNF